MFARLIRATKFMSATHKVHLTARTRQRSGRPAPKAGSTCCTGGLGNGHSQSVRPCGCERRNCLRSPRRGPQLLFRMVPKRRLSGVLREGVRERGCTVSYRSSCWQLYSETQSARPNGTLAVGMQSPVNILQTKPPPHPHLFSCADPARGRDTLARHSPEALSAMARGRMGV